MQIIQWRRPKRPKNPSLTREPPFYIFLPQKNLQQRKKKFISSSFHLAPNHCTSSTSINRSSSQFHPPHNQTPPLEPNHHLQLNQPPWQQTLASSSHHSAITGLQTQKHRWTIKPISHSLFEFHIEKQTLAELPMSSFYHLLTAIQCHQQQEANHHATPLRPPEANLITPSQPN